MKKLLFALAAVVAVHTSANAADMANKAPLPAPPVWNWSGLYVGAHLGPGWARKEWTDLNPPCDPFGFGVCASSAVSSHNALGVLGGGQIGVNYQAGWWVFGIEAELSAAKLKGDSQSASGGSLMSLAVPPCPVGADVGCTFTGTHTEALSTQINSLGTIAGRIGIVSDPADRTLFYVKGGAAFAKEDLRVAANASGLNCNLVFTISYCSIGQASTQNGSFSASQTLWGWMVGIGLEYGLAANWSAKIEYDYLDLGTRNNHFGGTLTTCISSGNTPRFGSPSPGTICTTGGSTRDFAIAEQIHTVKLGINYRFGYGVSPLLVK